MDEPRDPCESPEAKAERLRARKAQNQRDLRARPPGMRLYKFWGFDAHVEAVLEWRQLLAPNRKHSEAEIQAAIGKLIASLRPVRVTGDNAGPKFPAT